MSDIVEWDLNYPCMGETPQKLADNLKKSLDGFSEIKILFPTNHNAKIKVAKAMILAGWKLDKENNDDSGIYSRIG